MTNTLAPTMGLTQAAETLLIHPHSMEKLIRDGTIPAGKVGRAYVLMTRDVVAYAEKIVLAQTAERLSRKVTTSPLKGRRRAGSRSASASAGSYAR